jgi:uncharacterized BrkB/YihY/UPF0761 family membrane protein
MMRAFTTSPMLIRPTSTSWSITGKWRKRPIGLYIGSSSIASSYGAAGSLIIVLLWIFYSAQIFLLGAEFTKVYAARHGSHQDGRRHLLRRRAN